MVNQLTALNLISKWLYLVNPGHLSFFCATPAEWYEVYLWGAAFYWEV